MKVYCLLLSIALSCSASGDPHDNPAAMTMGSAPGAGLLDRVQDQQPEAQWRKEVLDLLTKLVLVQQEVSKGQNQVVQLLGTLGTQGLQQIQDLQNLARHQSLLVESHQALLLQTSRIATQLQEVSRKPLPGQ